jgi:hypothetical protein
MGVSLYFGFCKSKSHICWSLYVQRLAQVVETALFFMDVFCEGLYTLEC